MRMVAGSRPDLVIAWEWHIGLALLCGCSGALEYPTTNSCGPINKSLSLSLYSFATQPWVAISNDIFQWLIYNIICSLVLSRSIFISWKYQRQTSAWSGACSRELIYDYMNGSRNLRPTYRCEGEDEKSIFQCVPTALRCLDTPMIIYVLRRLRVWGWRSKND